MAKRRHSVRRYKRARTRSSSKRGGDFTPDEPGQIKPYVPFYNTETGKPTNTNVQFLDPTKISNVEKTDQVFPGIFEKSNPNDDESVFNQEPGFYSKDSVAERKRTAAAEEFNRLTEQYETDFPKSASEKPCADPSGTGCNIMGGLRRRNNSRRKTFKRKSFKRKTFKRKNLRSK